MKFKDEKERKAFENVYSAFTNNGKIDDGGEMSFSDLVSSPDVARFIPQVVEFVVREALEPNLVIVPNLFEEVRLERGTRIQIGAIGALHASEVAEGAEYKENDLQMDGGDQIAINVKKHGLMIRVTEEMLTDNQFDVIGLWLRAAGRALARHKEVKIFDYIRAMGVTVFDNVSPASSLNGVCTGRALDGSGNGSVTMDDIFDAYAQVITQGFFPDTLLMHPLTWTMFVKDATLRAFVLQNGGGSFFATWTGNPAGRAPWDASSQGGLGVSGGQLLTPGGAASGAQASPVGDHPQTLNSAPQLPGYLNIPFRIIVSPFVTFDTAKKLTDIYMFDSSELGVHIVDEEITTEEWDDPKVDIRKIKLRERYGLGILNEGLAIATLKNVHVVPNEIVLPAQATKDVSGSIAAIGATDTVL